MIDTNRDGWINQLARQIKPQASAAPARRGMPPRAALQRQLQAFQKRIKQAEEAGNKEQAERMKNRLKQMRQQIARASRNGDQQAKPAQVESDNKGTAAESVDVKKLVERAYLRTVSRYPDDSEMTRSLEFVAAADDPVKGLSGLLWALVNTKEFIVNH